MSREEILELIDSMIAEWDSVKTWAGVCKRDALKELKTEIIRRESIISNEIHGMAKQFRRTTADLPDEKPDEKR